MPLKDFTAIAQACHEANRAYCQSIGDHSQPPWYDAPQWQKDSAIKGVMLIAEKPETTPADSHASWSAQKIADGWVYGPTKDAEKKTHPCLRPYDELPIEQRAKDYLFGMTARYNLGLPQPVIPIEISALLRSPKFPLPVKRHPSITKDQIDALLAASTFEDTKLGRKTTVVVCILPNGFEVIESSGCVDPANYNHDLGVQTCKRRIIDRVWQLEGYRLQAKIFEARVGL